MDCVKRQTSFQTCSKPVAKILRLALRDPMTATVSKVVSLDAPVAKR